MSPANFLEKDHLISQVATQVPSHCIICGNSDSLISFKEHSVCHSCIQAIKETTNEYQIVNKA